MFTQTPPCEAGPGHSARGMGELAYAFTFPKAQSPDNRRDDWTTPHDDTGCVGFLGSAVDNG